jgi:hypothetical protein
MSRTQPQIFPTHMPETPRLPLPLPKTPPSPFLPRGIGLGKVRGGMCAGLVLLLIQVKCREGDQGYNLPCSCRAVCFSWSRGTANHSGSDKEWRALVQLGAGAFLLFNVVDGGKRGLARINSDVPATPDIQERHPRRLAVSPPIRQAARSPLPEGWPKDSKPRVCR